MYQTWLFDCDGVLLDSNRVKTAAFWAVAAGFCEAAADDFVDFHLKNNGLTRVAKFEHFFAKMLGRVDFTEDFERALRDFRTQVRRQLVECETTAGVEEFLSRLPAGSKRHVVSAGEEVELQDVLAHKRLARYFDGIHGAPRSKTSILHDLINANQLDRPAIFFGDAREDYRAASEFDLDFIFVSGYTALENWQQFCQDSGVQTVVSLADGELEALLLRSRS